MTYIANTAGLTALKIVHHSSVGVEAGTTSVVGAPTSQVAKARRTIFCRY